MGVKKSIDDMHLLAESKEFKCLSTVYINMSTPLKWKCSKGHIWEARPSGISTGYGCPECSNRKKLTINDMKAFAESRGGKCLSAKYKTNKMPLTWMCSEGHTWEARPDNVKNQAHWCPKCRIGKKGNNVKLTIEEMQHIAEERGGKCLSSTYINSATKLEWQCQKGHIWEAKPGHIKNSKSWCPECALETAGDARRFSIAKLQELAEYKGGKCLSETYKNSRTEMEWQCEYGHIWKAKAESILYGHWCHICSGRQRHNIEFVQEYAKSKGGLCLSEVYKNNRQKLKWQCGEGHIWESTFHDVKDYNTWCPHCNTFYSEEKVRFIMKSIFHKPFKKTRKILEQNLELDGYNEELNIAFEYHGIQHYKFDPFFFKTIEDFDRRQALDLYKKEMCQQKEIKLVIVPYNCYTSDESLAEYIFNCLEELKISLRISVQDIPFKDFYKSSTVLDELREIAKVRGGSLLSAFYINSKTPLKWQCSKGHIWKARPNNIKNGSWCPNCSGLKRNTIEYMHKLAKAKGGKCLSTSYVNNRSELLWQCTKGHIWETKPLVIVNGRWCPECSGKKKLTIEDMKLAAHKKGGECLSFDYPPNGERLKWRCAKGHEWEATSNAIRNGQWCRKCSGHQKLTIEEMREIAQSRGGKCFSETYKDNKTKLRWKCAKGHEWEATPNNIKSKGQWCPECNKEQGKK
ncbi:TPA: hypothetical protein QCQ08_001369 [Bacillus cereus]|nr:hypothetical protein [Bacillus cereus]